MYILYSFTQVDILYFGCMEFQILFDFHKKKSKPRLVTLKKILIPRYHSSRYLIFWLHGISNFVRFSQKKVKTPSCYFEKNLNTPLSFTLKKVFAPLYSAPAPLYSKFFKPPNKSFCCTYQMLEIFSGHSVFVTW